MPPEFSVGLMIKRLERQLAEAQAETQRYRELIAQLLLRVGESATCRGCGAAITFVRHNNGKHAPYDADGVSHFATCSHAAKFRRERTEVK